MLNPYNQDIVDYVNKRQSKEMLRACDKERYGVDALCSSPSTDNTELCPIFKQLLVQCISYQKDKAKSKTSNHVKPYL